MSRRLAEPSGSARRAAAPAAKPTPPVPDSAPNTDRPDAAPHRGAPLFHTDRGQVRRCPCCDRLELRFGNALLALAPADLPALLDQLGDAEAGDADAGDAEAGGAGDPAADVGREATLFLGDTGCGWVFTGDELAELHRLAAGAQLMLALGAPPAA